MPRFETKFVDGKTLVHEAQTRDEAKIKAKQERRAKLPAGTPGSAPEIKVVSVMPVDEERNSNRSRDDRDRETRDRERDDRDRETRDRERADRDAEDRRRLERETNDRSRERGGEGGNG